MRSTQSTTRWRLGRKLSLAQGCHFVVRFHQTGGGYLNRASSLLDAFGARLCFFAFFIWVAEMTPEPIMHIDYEMRTSTKEADQSAVCTIHRHLRVSGLLC